MVRVTCFVTVSARQKGEVPTVGFVDLVFFKKNKEKKKVLHAFCDGPMDRSCTDYPYHMAVIHDHG